MAFWTRADGEFEARAFSGTVIKVTHNNPIVVTVRWWRRVFEVVVNIAAAVTVFVYVTEIIYYYGQVAKCSNVWNSVTIKLLTKTTPLKNSAAL